MATHHNRQLISYDGSWCRRLAPLEGMSLDIIHVLADYSSIEDMVALTIVSKPLRSLSSDRSIWKKLYMRSTLLLPPGPFEWQSTSYLIRALLRGKRFHSVWPSSNQSPEVFLTRPLRLGCIVALSVLMGRWLLFAVGSTLFCCDSLCSNISDSAVALHDAGIDHRILRVFSVGTMGEDGVSAVAVLLFHDTFTIAKVLMNRGKPLSLQTVLTSRPIVARGWMNLVAVRLYHRLLVMNVGECSSDWESSGRLVIMDIGTLRRYRIPTSTDGAVFDPMHVITFFFATKTHFVKVTETHRPPDIHSKVECFAIPTAPDTLENDVLCPSHQNKVAHSLSMRDCVVIYESPIDTKTGKISFALCGLENNRLHVMDICLEPDGSVSLIKIQLASFPVTSFCIGLFRKNGYGLACTTEGTLAFELRYVRRGLVMFTFSELEHLFFGPSKLKLLGLDTFVGIAFFVDLACAGDTSVETVDVIHDVHQGRGFNGLYRHYCQDGWMAVDWSHRASGRRKWFFA